MGSPHRYNDHIIQWVFEDKILIKFPYDRYDLWTNTFKIVREEIKRYAKPTSVQLSLF